MNRIAIVTATRAEYGLLKPLIKRVLNEKAVELDLIVTGGHLSKKQGMTVREIEEDGIPIAHRIDILENDNSPYGISLTMSNAMRGFAGCFREDRPDLLVILGDRTEMLGVASAAMNERIPIAHIHGGEITQGAVDDSVRHALTKLSYLHFTSTEAYRKRVIRLGEEPDRVYNFGALGVENILSTSFISEKEIRRDIGVQDCVPYAVVTFHPATLENDTEDSIEELLEAMNQKSDVYYCITGANADAGGDRINAALKKYAHENVDRAFFTESLGMVRYLSALKHASFVLGNSSSGILEAPVFGVPTVNIGDRQKGRLKADSVIDCEPGCRSIYEAIDWALKMKCKPSNLYGDGHTSEKIMNVIMETLLDGGINVKKHFYDGGWDV